MEFLKSHGGLIFFFLKYKVVTSGSLDKLYIIRSSLLSLLLCIESKNIEIMLL